MRTRYAVGAIILGTIFYGLWWGAQETPGNWPYVEKIDTAIVRGPLVVKRIPDTSLSILTVDTTGLYNGAYLNINKDSTVYWRKRYGDLVDSVKRGLMKRRPTKADIEISDRHDRLLHLWSWCEVFATQMHEKQICFENCGNRDSALFYQGAYERAVKDADKYADELFGTVLKHEPLNCCKP